MSLPADFERTEEGGFPILVVRGRIATGDVSLLEAHLMGLKTAAADHAVLDLVECPYLTSRCFPLILDLTRTLRGRGHDLLVAVGADLFDLFRVLRLDARISLCPTREECIRAARFRRGLV